MALIKCPECGKENVSDTAEACPECGFNMKKCMADKQINRKQAHKKDIEKSEPEVADIWQKRKKWIPVLCFLTILVLGGFLYNPIVSRFNYQKGVKAIEDKQYDDAIEIFTSMNSEEYRDEIDECMYLKAKQLMGSGEYDDAIFVLGSLGTYHDSEEMLLECQYQKANQYFMDKQYDMAADLYFSLGDYKESEDKRIDCIYYSAELYYQNKDYYTAAEMLYVNHQTLKEYDGYDNLRDSIYAQKDWFLEKAEQEYADGNFACAHQCYYYGMQQDSQLPAGNHYQETLFMESIQGEYVELKLFSSEQVHKGLSIEKYILAKDGIKYEIAPCEQERGEIVGYINGAKDSYISFDAHDEVITWVGTPDENKTNSAWESIERHAQREEDEQKKKEQQVVTQAPKIGMTKTQVETSTWGKPTKINKTTYAWGVTEQWCYPNYKYIYFEDGIVTAIQE